MSPSEILFQLIAIPSVNPMGRDVSGDIYYESRMSDWLESFFRSFGAPFERIEVAPGRANILARYDSTTSNQTLLLDAHQDTVPVDGMTIDPFSPAIRDGKIFGRGAADVKGGMAAMLYAFRRLFFERPRSAPHVVMSCSCDEESTATGVRDLVSYWQTNSGVSRLLPARPTAAVIAEPTELNAVVAHRGVVRFRVHAHGRACHSSDPTQGKNAIYAMAHVVTRLEELASELSNQVQPHPLCGSATMSVGRIDGGTSVNIVPAHCEIEIDRRIVPGEDPKLATLQLQREISSITDGIVCDPPWISCPALGNEVNEWVADALLRHGTQIGRSVSKIGVPYCTHASTISDAGVPSVVFGPGSIAQAHTADEFIEVEQLELAAEIYFRFCCDENIESR